MMKKLAFLLILSLVAVCTVSARGERGAFTKGNSLAAANFGLKLFAAPHFSASYEYCLLSGFYERGSLGVGAYVATNFGRLASITTRATLHNQFNKMDFYVGVLNGVNLIDLGPYLGGWTPYYGFDFYLGWRFAFTDNWGMNVELAPLPWPWLAQPIVSVGANFKF